MQVWGHALCQGGWSQSGQGLQPSLGSTCEDRGPHRAVHTHEAGRLLLTHGKPGRGSDGTPDLSL